MTIKKINAFSILIGVIAILVFSASSLMAQLVLPCVLLAVGWFGYKIIPKVGFSSNASIDIVLHIDKFLSSEQVREAEALIRKYKTDTCMLDMRLYDNKTDYEKLLVFKQNLVKYVSLFPDVIKGNHIFRAKFTEYSHPLFYLDLDNSYKLLSLEK